MLTILTPEQVSNFWDIIKYAIEQSLPPIVGDHPDKMNRILSSLLSSQTQCWASYTRIGDTPKFEGIVLTKMIYDDASDTKNLLIYCLYGYEEVAKESWVKGLVSLIKYANSKECEQIIAYTEIPYIVEVAKQLGGETKYTFLSFNVDEFVQKLNNLEGL